MAVSTRVEPIDRDIELMLSEELSPKAQARLFAEYAGEQIDEAKQTNKTILGRVPRMTVAVDGREGAALESVRPDGVIIAEFELVNDVLAWIGEQLVKHSPVGKTGNYQRSHTLFADANEVSIGSVVPPADEYLFVNMVPYARKIELGSSSQAPDGVYQAVAILGKARFGNIAKIFFTYRGVVGGQQINLVGGTFFRGRSKKGRFVRAGGTRAHNVSSVRFPAISVRPN